MLVCEFGGSVAQVCTLPRYVGKFCTYGMMQAAAAILRRVFRSKLIMSDHTLEPSKHIDAASSSVYNFLGHVRTFEGRLVRAFAFVNSEAC